MPVLAGTSPRPTVSIKRTDYGLFEDCQLIEIIEDPLIRYNQDSRFATVKYRFEIRL